MIHRVLQIDLSWLSLDYILLHHGFLPESSRGYFLNKSSHGFFLELSRLLPLIIHLDLSCIIPRVFSESFPGSFPNNPWGSSPELFHESSLGRCLEFTLDSFPESSLDYFLNHSYIFFTNLFTRIFSDLFRDYILTGLSSEVLSGSSAGIVY